MSDHITPAPAPQAPQPSVAPAPPPAQASSSAPADASHHTPRPATTTTTTHAPVPGSAPAATQNPTVTTEAPQTLNERVNAVDRYWKFKGAIQVAIIISGLIGIGAVASLTAAWPDNGNFFYDIPSAPWPSLITFAISIVWCLSCFANIVRCKRPIAPGARVAFELLLWLGFIVSCLFATAYFISFLEWGAGGQLYAFSSYRGDYELQSNNTWVWEADNSGYSSTPYTRSCSSGMFSTCAEQDAYVNEKWSQKPHREQIELMGLVCQYISLLLHFTLFVWACIDTHRYNHSKVSQDAEKLAANIIQTMVNNGAIIPPPGQAHMRPIPWGQPGHYSLPQQGAYPMHPAYPQYPPNGQPMMHPQSVPQGGEQAPALPPRPMAGPVNEKTEGPRYA